MQFSLGTQVDLHPEGVRQIELQADDAQHRCAVREINKQIQVAAFMVVASGRSAKNAHLTLSVFGGQTKKGVALRCDGLRRAHERILAYAGPWSP